MELKVLRLRQSTVLPPASANQGSSASASVKKRVIDWPHFSVFKRKITLVGKTVVSFLNEPKDAIIFLKIRYKDGIHSRIETVESIYN